MDPIEVFDSIIYGNRHPKRQASTSDDSFKVMIDKIEYLVDDPQMSYSLKFKKPITLKRRFYKKLIDYNKVSYIVNTFKRIENSAYKDQDYYLFDTVLNDVIEPYIIACSKILNEIPFSPSDEMVDFQLKSVLLPSEGYEDYPYIFEYLFNSLIHIYIEIQDRYPHLCNEELKDFDSFKEELLAPKFMREKELFKAIFKRKENYNHLTEKKLANTYSESFVEEVDDNEKFNNQDSTSLLKTFTYIRLNENPEAIRLLYESLANQGFIDENDKTTNYKNFKKFFSGIEVSEVEPIRWVKDNSSFAHFIWLLHEKHNTIKNMRQKQWKVAFKLFINRKGNTFPYTTRKSIKSITYSDALEKALNCLKN